ncbi:hypothetical protein ID866_943 [Astraeus odoratus]|nr:hypothetical protein ID866_943 [Astraeus odoratus]
MAGHYRTSARRSPAATDVVTYRLDDKMIYVPLDYNWRQALAHARHSFEKLSGVDEKRITFSLNVINDGQRRSVGISPSAWRSVASHLARYEIIDIRVTPEVVITDMDAPPRYSSPSLMSSCTDTKRRCHNSSEIPVTITERWHEQI